MTKIVRGRRYLRKMRKAVAEKRLSLTPNGNFRCQLKMP